MVVWEFALLDSGHDGGIWGSHLLLFLQIILNLNVQFIIIIWGLLLFKFVSFWLDDIGVINKDLFLYGASAVRLILSDCFAVQLNSSIVVDQALGAVGQLFVILNVNIYLLQSLGLWFVVVVNHIFFVWKYAYLELSFKYLGILLDVLVYSEQVQISEIWPSHFPKWV